MADEREPTVTEEAFRQLARVGKVPVEEQQVGELATQLNGLLEEANLVNRFMAGRREVGPAVRFAHPEDPREEE